MEYKIDLITAHPHHTRIASFNTANTKTMPNIEYTAEQQVRRVVALQSWQSYTV